MKFKKLWAVVLAAALVATSLTACGGGDATTDGSNANTPVADSQEGDNAVGEDASVEENLEAAGVLQPNTEKGNTQVTDETLIIQLGSYPDNFWHPGAAAMGANEEQIINAALLDRLVDYDYETGEVLPALAETWEVNGKDFTFHIRSGVTMTDGSELTVDDVVYSANVWKEQCASNDTGKFIENVTKVDDSTVTITFTIAAPDALKMLTWANYGIVSEDEVNALGGLEAASQNPVMGCGKYKFKECKAGEYVIIERNDNYWNPEYKGYFKEIKFTFVNDSNAKVSAVMSGDADVAYDMPVAQANTFVSNADLRTYIYEGPELEHIFFNLREDHPTSDLKVRQAIDKALDYDAIAQVGTAGYGKAALSYVKESTPYYVAGWTTEERAVDVEAAKALLAEAGYDESNPLKITTVTLPDLLDVYTVMQANLAEAGIELEIQQVDMGGFVPAMLFDKSYDIILIGEDSSTRAPFLTQFVAPGVVFGGPGVELPNHEEILTRLITAADDTEATAIVEEYQNLLREDFTCTNAYVITKSSIVGKDIKGYSIRERGYIDVTALYK